MVEVAAALSMAGSAFKMLKGAIEQGREVQDMYAQFAQFFDAKESLAEADQHAKNPSMVGSLFGGSSVEAQALQVTAARHKIKQLEKELYEYLLYTGQQQFYDDMMKERRVIRQRRIEAAQAAARKRANIIDGIAIVLFLCFCAAMIAGFMSIL
jgi:hypothetical protein